MRQRGGGQGLVLPQSRSRSIQDGHGIAKKERSEKKGINPFPLTPPVEPNRPSGRRIKTLASPKDPPAEVEAPSGRRRPPP